MCRFLKSVGHQVILADVYSFRLNLSRFSNAVDEWVTLPDLDAENLNGTKLSETSCEIWLMLIFMVTLGFFSVKYLGETPMYYVLKIYDHGF